MANGPDRVEAEHDTSGDRWRSLLEATVALDEDRDDATMLQRIVDSIRELIGAKYAALGVVSDDGDTLVDFIHSGLGAEQVARIGDLPTGRGLLGELLTNPEALRLHELRVHHSSAGFPVHHPPMHTFLGVPIRSQSEVVGNLYLAEKYDGLDFTDEDQAIAEGFAAQAGLAIERSRLHAQRERDTRRVTALFDAIQAITEAQGSDAVLQVIVDAARELVDAEFAALGVLRSDGTFERFIHSGMEAATWQRIEEQPVGTVGLLGTVTVEQRTLRLADLGEHPASVGFPPHHPPMHSFLGVPVRSGPGIIANIYLTNKRAGREFTDEDESLVETIAGQAAIAIENSRSYDRERLMVSRMEALVAANLTLTKELQLDAVLQRVVEIARDLAGAEYAALGVLDDEGSGLANFIHAGMDPDLVEQIGPLPQGKGVLRAVMVAQRPIRISRLADHPASSGFPDHHPPMDAFLGVPVEYLGRVLGNLYLTNKRGGGAFTEEDELVVSALAAQAAVSIRNANTYAREQELVSELRSLNAAKSEFVSTVSHELRSPLAALTGLAQTVSRHGRQMAADDVDQAMDAIGRQATRLIRLVDDLLDLSRMESGRVALDMGPVPLRPAVTAALEGCGASDGREIVLDIADSVTVEADPSRLDQVLVNLLTNAERFAASSITIHADRAANSDDAVEIVVIDDGPGVSRELEPRLFERFARGRNPGGGTGLGLAISKALVEAMHGTIGYQRSPEGGASFHVLLRESAP